MSIPAHLLTHLPYFAAVARLQSFTLAAEQLHVTQAAVSYQIRQLELKLDVVLIHRQSGSHLYLSAAGKQLATAYQHFEQALEQTLNAIRPQRLEATVRLTAPVDFASKVLPHALLALKQLAPRLNVELQVSDTLADLVAEGLDFAIRTTTNDERLQHELLLNANKSLIASPSYLANKPVIYQLTDLNQHVLLVRGTGHYFSWNQLLGLQGVKLDSHYKTLVLGNSFALEEGAKAGLGLALLADFIVSDAVTRGRLQRLLPSFTQALTTPFYLSYVNNPQNNFLKDYIKQAIQQAWQQLIMSSNKNSR